MNFEQALFEYSLKAGEVLKAPANIVIYFEEGNSESTASLRAPKYYRDKEGTMNTVKRAWECFCRGDKEKLYSISSIDITYEGAENGEEQKDKRCSA